MQREPARRRQEWDGGARVHRLERRQHSERDGHCGAGHQHLAADRGGLEAPVLRAAVEEGQQDEPGASPHDRSCQAQQG